MSTVSLIVFAAAVVIVVGPRLVDLARVLWMDAADDRHDMDTADAILTGRPGWRSAERTEDGQPETPGQLLPELAAAETPGLQPAPPITLPTHRPRACSECGEEMGFGIAHYCRRAA